ncbi:MAG: alpha/beta fold hydrolase [Acetobacteraceae bacterium]
MILHAVELGEGPVVLLLHGLFGAATNFGSVQRRLAVGRRVVAMDLRNHGASPHDAVMSYAAMAGDVFETLDRLGVGSAALVGHSMGGKVAMQAALLRPERVSRLLVADIAPVVYPPRNGGIAAAMLGIGLSPGLSRAAAGEALAGVVGDPSMRAFLLQNLRFGAVPAWRIGLAEIAAGLGEIEGWSAPDGRVYGGPALVLRGENSDYVRPEHRVLFRALFPAARFASLRGAGHWLHADAPDAFTGSVGAFLGGAG